MNVAMNTKKVI